MGYDTIKFEGVGVALTLKNNTVTPLTSADLRKLVVIKSGDEAALASDGAADCFVLTAIAADAATVTVERGRAFDDIPYTSTAPDPTSATPWADADGAGGVTGIGTYTNMRVLKVDTTAHTCSILVR